MKHRIVTRFAVPRPEPDTAELYRSLDWLEERLELLRRFFVPSVGRLGVPAVLLCGSEVADFIAGQIEDLPWARVVEQDDWHGGYTGEADEILTRLDSDDAIHRGWIEAVEATPAAARVLVTREFLRYDLRAGRLHRYRRREPSPLAAFRGGENPYALDHKYLDQLGDVHDVDGPYLLQVVHDGNVANHRPKAWRLDRRVSRDRLSAFGVR